jgi:hypothetical protein
VFATFTSWCCEYVVHQCAFFASCRACQCMNPQPHIMPLRQSPMCPPAWLKALSRIRSRCLMSFNSRLRSPIKSSMWSCIVCLSVIVYHFCFSNSVGVDCCGCSESIRFCRHSSAYVKQSEHLRALWSQSGSLICSLRAVNDHAIESADCIR